MIKPGWNENLHIREKYRDLLRKGVSHDEAVFQATLGTPYNPRKDHSVIGLCETTFLRDFGCNQNYVAKTTDPRRRRSLLAAAKKAGVSIAGKSFNPAIATSLNDPEAWVGSLDDIQRVCKKRGWQYGIKDGNVDVRIPEDDFGPMKRLKERQKKAKVIQK